jgi:thiosulfate reductase cytochrome b subunit
MEPAMTTPIPPTRTTTVILRHALATRMTHWINALCILVLILSGLQIFNAHPALYLGQASDFDAPVLAMTARTGPDGTPIGETTLLGATFETTGVLGLSTSAGRPEARGFPAWLTLPTYRDLATGRRWHFFFAWLFVINGLAYLAYSVASRHLSRDLVPGWRELRSMPRAILDHLRLRFDHGRDYNVLQKLAYLGLIVVVLPLVVATGLTMSPGMNAAVPWLVELFGGRQTARTLHFVCATLIVLFIVVHLVMVVLSGPINNLRSMITGRYRTNAPEAPHAP